MNHKTFSNPLTFGCNRRQINYLHFRSQFAQALKLLGNNSDLRISYDRLHKMTGRAMPIQMMNYKHSLLLFKLNNETRQTEDWMDLNWNQAFNNSYMNVRLFDVLKNKVGKNILTNRLATAFLKGSKNCPLSALRPPPSTLRPPPSNLEKTSLTLSALQPDLK